MSAGTATIPVGASPASHREGRGCFVPLLAKELRESRATIIVGLVIFWLLPALWEFLYVLIPPHELFAQFSWGLLATAGWLFAAIVGAQTVCRDLGRPEEHFLLALPAPARTIVAAKLVAGLSVVLLIVLVAGLWDLLLQPYSEYWSLGSQTRRELLGSYLPVVAPILVFNVAAFGFAFMAAVITRQMLVSAVFSTMLLLIWLVTPLVSSRLGFLYPEWIFNSVRHEGVLMLSPPPRLLLDSGFLLTSLTVLVVPPLVALLASGHGCSVRIGMKPLAWSIAALVLILLGMALREVGNSLPVESQAVLNLRPEMPVNLVNKGACFVGVQGQQNREFGSAGEQAPPALSLASFNVNGAGIITDLRSGRVAIATLPGEIPQDFPVWFLSPHVQIADSRRLLVTVGPLAGLNGLQSVRRMIIDWPMGEEPAVVSTALLELPQPPESHSVRMLDFAETKRFVYVLYATKRDDDKEHTWFWEHAPHHLRVFDVAGASVPEPIKDIELRSRTAIAVLDEKLVVASVWGYSEDGPLIREAVLFDADKPESLGDGSDWKYLTAHQLSGKLNACSLEQVFGSSRDRSKAASPSGSLTYQADLFGLSVQRRARAGQSETVEELRASPLAWVFRINPRLWLLDTNLLLEQTESALALYDLADAERPRPAGFLHVWYPDVFPLEHYLVLTEGRLITVVRRPVPGKAGPPVQLWDRWMLKKDNGWWWAPPVQ